MGLAHLHVGANGGIQKSLGRPRKITTGMENQPMEFVCGIGGNEGNKEGSGIRELVMAKQRRQESKKRRERVVRWGRERGNMFLSPFEEREENTGLRTQSFRGENGGYQGR